MASAVFEGTSLVNMFVRGCWVNGVRRLVVSRRGDEEDFFEVRTEWSDRSVLYLHRSLADLGRLWRRLRDAFPEDRPELARLPLRRGRAWGTRGRAGKEALGTRPRWGRPGRRRRGPWTWTAGPARRGRLPPQPAQGPGRRSRVSGAAPPWTRHRLLSLQDAQPSRAGRWGQRPCSGSAGAPGVAGPILGRPLGP
ncbi:PX domain-containing protein 1 [Galemys pyrenaicus]|uniref:PX domain-containing protein 1 n=1 Tax=Galemys pyrenaicus TaxID=202257 RepID=A0A8J6DG60_GALPY|nr:PX domain-containing protein 1 [Galemys pyrenaicus]